MFKDFISLSGECPFSKVERRSFFAVKLWISFESSFFIIHAKCAGVIFDFESVMLSLFRSLASSLAIQCAVFTGFAPSAATVSKKSAFSFVSQRNSDRRRETPYCCLKR